MRTSIFATHGALVSGQAAEVRALGILVPVLIFVILLLILLIALWVGLGDAQVISRLTAHTSNDVARGAGLG